MEGVLSLVTAPAGEPLKLADAKRHARVDGSFDDALVRGYMATAADKAEEITGKALLTQTWDLFYDCWPECGYIELPKPPLQTVTSIKYYDSNGVLQTLSPSVYTVSAPQGPKAAAGRIDLAYNQYWPSIRPINNAVVVRFICGYGAEPDVPNGIKVAMQMHVAELYNQREGYVTGSIVSDVPNNVRVLLASFSPLGGLGFA